MEIKVGDKLTRMLAGQIPLEVIVGEITNTTFKVGSADGKVLWEFGWTFDIVTGIEIDEDLGAEPDTYVISYIKEVIYETSRKN